MSEERENKIEELFRRLASEFILGETNGTSLITVTRSGISKNLRESMIFVTILPESREEEALHFLKRKRGDFREYVKKHSRLKYLPHFDFAVDLGEKNRRRIDEIS